jgi:protein-S-isoprenylcysteine O-methyltransferase Ste14
MLGKSVVVFSSVLVTSITAGLMVRMSKEDAMLEKHFGEEWLLWSATVPYKLIPGVF